MDMDAIHATARLLKVAKNDDAPLLGTCFAFGHPRFFVTAAHCVDSVDVSDLIIAPEKQDHIGKVRNILAHPTADLAILESANDKIDGSPDFFWGTPTGPYPMGANFFAYGFPELSLNKPVAPRVFAGIYQRFFPRTSTLHQKGDSSAPKYRYMAGELSIGCPAGLSGGPVFLPNAPQWAWSLVTGNIEVGTTLHSTEETQEDGKQYRSEINRIIIYGVGLMLGDVSDWLNSNIPFKYKKTIPTALALCGMHERDRMVLGL